MKIAITADPVIPVPPEYYGGIERVIDVLSRGLQERGHQVTLVAHPSSSGSFKLIPYLSATGSWRDHLNNIRQVRGLKKFSPDVLHSFSRLAYLLPFLRTSLPKIMSYQREPTLSQVRRSVLLAKKNTLYFTGCSDYITGQIKPHAPSTTIYNCIDLKKYTFNSAPAKKSPLAFLGRIEPIKGVHNAVDAAEAAGRELLIAGNISPEHRDYFNKLIKPRLNGSIQYIGPVDDTAKNLLLGGAAALLMPIEWNEPFGIVMIEAMACGTPVIGYKRGAVTEVITEGVSGYTCTDVAGMVRRISSLDQIDRGAVRQDAERRFSADVIVDQYLGLYRKLSDRK